MISRLKDESQAPKVFLQSDFFFISKEFVGEAVFASA
jgi:hypothetical protein